MIPEPQSPTGLVPGDAWGEIRFWKEFPDGPRKDATYDPKIRLKDGTLVDWWELKEDAAAAARSAATTSSRIPPGRS